MGKAAGAEPSRLLEAFFLQPGRCLGRAACRWSIGQEGRMRRSRRAGAWTEAHWSGKAAVPCSPGLQPRSEALCSCVNPCLAQLCVILSSFLSLLAPCRTRHRESRQRLHEFGRPTVAAGSVPALPTQQMLIQIRIKNNNNNNN